MAVLDEILKNLGANRETRLKRHIDRILENVPISQDPAYQLGVTLGYYKALSDMAQKRQKMIEDQRRERIIQSRKLHIEESAKAYRESAKEIYNAFLDKEVEDIMSNKKGENIWH